MQRRSQGQNFARRARAADVHLLAVMDERHHTPNGLALKKLCERAYRVFGQQEYGRLATSSGAHLYNLRRSPAGRQRRPGAVARLWGRRPRLAPHIHKCHNNKESHSRGFWRYDQNQEYTLTKPPGCPTNQDHLILHWIILIGQRYILPNDANGRIIFQRQDMPF